MEDSIMLHQDIKTFKSAVKETSDNLNIRDFFIEKDYWITLALKRLSASNYADFVVFKGGTSLSKAHRLINRFSEDIDIAVVNDNNWSGNKVKNLIRDVEKEITEGLTEEQTPEVTSKGSRFRKSVFSYPTVFKDSYTSTISNKLIVEINSFANPFPYHQVKIQSMIGEFLQMHNQTALIEKYDLGAFYLNVLDKNQTLLEKLVSLIRFSYSTSPIESISGKIRHFYDLYYLLADEECKMYINSDHFKADFNTLLKHDKAIFNDPIGWSEKHINQSPLIMDFDTLWTSLKTAYNNELQKVAFSKIPDAELVKSIIQPLLNRLL